MGFSDFFLCYTDSDNTNIHFLFSSPLTAIMNELKKVKVRFSRVCFPSELHYVCVINYTHWWVLKNHRHAYCLGKQSQASLVSSAWAFKW